MSPSHWPFSLSFEYDNRCRLLFSMTCGYSRITDYSLNYAQAEHSEYITGTLQQSPFCGKTRLQRSDRWLNMLLGGTLCESFQHSKLNAGLQTSWCNGLHKHKLPTYMNHMQVCAERKTIQSDACLQGFQDHFIIIQMLKSLVDIKFLFFQITQSSGQCNIFKLLFG